MEERAQIVLPAKHLPTEISWFEDLSFKLIHIYPDDNPQTAIMKGFGLMLRLEVTLTNRGPELVLTSDDPKLSQSDSKRSPSGTTIRYERASYQVDYPPIKSKFEMRRLQDQDPWVIGRAGMHYRDLIPSRLGGGIIASHIRIPEGGRVPDSVHYHTIGFQLIYCYKGWVRLVYEDQGEPFLLHSGDCVTQPPEIRHRVLEASDQLEVIEIGVPAEHMTTIDHEMELPTGNHLPQRMFSGQKFCHFVGSKATWQDSAADGFQISNTGIDKATAGMADVRILRFMEPEVQTPPRQHAADIFFAFVLSGKVNISIHDVDTKLLAGDAFVLPRETDFVFTECSRDLELLEVKLPAAV